MERPADFGALAMDISCWPTLYFRPKAVKPLAANVAVAAATAEAAI